MEAEEARTRICSKMCPRPTFDSSLTKSILELAMELVTEVRSITEWHRRMTHEHLNQSGRVINLDKLAVGTEVYFYKPPTVHDVKQKGRKAKHLEHYVGPARKANTIVIRIATRSNCSRERRACSS